ncbi:SRPBCC family protein [Streptomyces qinzhouensis]|uniref:SRPBCC family protein n=1 Tax=Streptomyces qinzhouensis TaxID=2599401 RepID=A0A5B8IBL1_9ACTN|nr:SRPBCC family protein [Streptomyces qinzhouensis]QDY75478.1 SRPBCC family protein [Streptomyces qinzhouensis]
MVRRLRPVGLDFLRSAPVRPAFTAALSASPRAVYRALAEDVPGWVRWFGAVTEAVPVRDGAGRDVRLRIGVRFEETILAADAFTRYAYRVDVTNAPGITALAEEWWIEAVAGGGSRVRWTFAVDGPPAALAVTRAARPGLHRSFRGAMRALDRTLAAG